MPPCLMKLRMKSAQQKPEPNEDERKISEIISAPGFSCLKKLTYLLDFLVM